MVSKSDVANCREKYDFMSYFNAPLITYFSFLSVNSSILFVHELVFIYFTFSFMIICFSVFVNGKRGQVYSHEEYNIVTLSLRRGNHSILFIFIFMVYHLYEGFIVIIKNGRMQLCVMCRLKLFMVLMITKK